MQPYTPSQNTMLLLTRFIVAAIFLVAAYYKIVFWSSTAETMHMSASMFNLMKFLTIAEPIGALALILGFLTRSAATCLGIIMLGAMYVMKFNMGIGFVTPTGAGWNFPLAVLAPCLVLMAFGAGNYSIDGMWHRALNKPMA